MAQIYDPTGTYALGVDSHGSLQANLFDGSGYVMTGAAGANLPANGGSGLIVGGTNDGAFRPARFDRMGNIRAGFDTLLFRDSAETGAVSGTPIAPNLNQWTTAVSTFAVGLPTTNGNQLTSTTSGAYAIATSLRQFQKLQKGPLYYRRRGRNVVYSGSVSEFGFGAPTTVTAVVPNGAFWRYGSDGTIRPVLSFTNAETVGADISAAITTAGGNSNYYIFEVIVGDNSVQYVCQNGSTGQSINEQTLYVGNGATKVWGVSRLPIFERVYNATAPATGPTVYFSDVYVCGMDIFNNKPWQHQIAASTQGGPEVYPGAFVAANSQNANYSNSAAPASATLSNTAAGYTTLGGQWQFAAVAGAETDYALFAFTVPTGFTFMATGIHISSINTGAAVATTATILQWSVANNSSAVSLATAGLTRSTVGMQGFQVAAAIGATTNELDTIFDTPLRTDGGRIMHVILKMPVGTATASQVVRGVCSIRGYFE